MQDAQRPKSATERIPSVDDRVMIEQMRVIHNATPFIFLLVSLAAASLSVTYFGRAPWYLTLVPPIGLAVLSAIQINRWIDQDDSAITVAIAKREFRTMELISVGVFLMLGFWVWSFFPYSRPSEHVFLAFFTGFAGIGLSATLLPRPRMIALNTSLAFVGFCLMFIGQGERFFFSMAAIFGAAYAVFYVASKIYKKRIRAMVEVRAELEVQNRQARYLLGVNRSLARTDALTGLPNRRHFFETLENYYQASPEGSLPVVCLVDLDGFKPINDVFGHAAGDAVLVETATRIRQVIGAKGVVARLGGDEFAFLLPWTVSDEDVEQLAGQAKDAFNQPFRFSNGETNRITASVGFSSRIVDAGSAKALLEQADFALYRAKANESSTAVMFSATDVRQQRRERMVDQALRSADFDKEIYLMFQPIVDSTTGKVQYCEALARWNSAELGLVSPAEFVPVAEKAGLTRRLAVAATQKVIQHLREWPATAAVSVNFSAQDVTSEQTIQQIYEMLSVEQPQLRQRISIELTESSLLSDFSEVSDHLKRLRSLGVKVALDDFGTGFSSLGYLQEIEFDVVKVDRSFVNSVEVSEKSFNLVRIIHLLTRTLGIDCVTEGVETIEQLTRVRAAGGRLIQGFLYAKPLEAREIEAYFAGVRQFAPAEDLLPAGDLAKGSGDGIQYVA